MCPTEDSWGRWQVTAKQAWGKQLRKQGCGAWGRADLGNSGIDGESHGEAVLSSAPGITCQQTELSCPGRDHLEK